jgi:hypothetical protein
MPRYTAWKVVTASGQKTGLRSENKTYEWLRAWAAQQPDGIKADVYVQESGSDKWHLFERHVVRNGFLNEA